MPAVGPRRDDSFTFPMKRPGLSPALLAATLILTTIVVSAADEPKPAPAMRGSRADQLLKRFDKNGDGKLDEAELADAHEAMLQEQMTRQATIAAAPRAPQFQAKMLEMFDKNHDGRLDDEERAEMRKYAEQNGLGENGEVREELLRRFDKNADGKLDDAERMELQRFLEERRGQGTAPVREFFLRQFDRNNDGKIDEAEWAAAKEQVLRLVNAPTPLQMDAGAPNPKEEQAKLERAAAEVARRRVLREQAAKGASKP